MTEKPAEPKKSWWCWLGFHKWVDVNDGLPPVTEGSGNAFGAYQEVYGRYQHLRCNECGKESLWDVEYEREL